MLVLVRLVAPTIFHINFSKGYPAMAGTDRCQQCHVESEKLLRCSQCRKVRYCSIMCQRKDWTRHRSDCIQQEEVFIERRQPNKLSLQNATNANDADHRNTLKDRLNDTPRNNKSNHIIGRNKADTLPSEKLFISLDHQKIINKMLWNVYLEDMENLCCYQILLRPNLRESLKLSLGEVSFSIKRSDPYDTMHHTIHFACPIPDCPKPVQEIRIEFPRSLIPECHQMILVDDDEAISIRLSYSKTSHKHNKKDNTESSRCVSLDNIQNMCCRNCNLKLIVPTIFKVLPLPSGRFDEMDEYFMCYEGDLAIDFSTSSMCAQSGIILEDSTSFVLHQSDVSETVCVLSTVGYGQPEDFIFNTIVTNGILNLQATLLSLDSRTDDCQGPVVRGIRQWRDTIGGMPLTCSLCASVLGFTPHDSPEMYRLLKHRLSSSTPVSFMTLRTLETINETAFSICSFIVNEMVRYAETQAVFGLDVMTSDRNGTPKSLRNETFQKCIRLRLIGWDSITCDNSDFVINSHGNFSVSKWNRSAKVIYEDLSVQLRRSEIMLHEEESTWMLNDVDWCCLPSKSDKKLFSSEKGIESTVNSFARIFISNTEWNELLHQLFISSKRFPIQTKEAIISTKLGLPLQNTASIGLAMLNF